MTPHLERISRVVWPTWDRYLELPATERIAFDASTEASILHRYMADAATREFSGVPGVQLLGKYRFALGIEGFPQGVDGLVVCRFKRLDAQGRSRSYPTDRCSAIVSNDPKIDGFPDGATILDVGYVFNDLRTGYRDVQIVRVAGTKFIMSVPKVNDQSIQMPLTLPDSNAERGTRFQIIRPAADAAQG